MIGVSRALRVLILLVICASSLARENILSEGRYSNHKNEKDLSSYIAFYPKNELRAVYKKMENRESDGDFQKISVVKLNYFLSFLRDHQKQLFCEWGGSENKKPLETSVGLAEKLLGKEALKKVSEDSLNKTTIGLLFSEAIENWDKETLLDIVFFDPYSEFALEGLYRLFIYAIDHSFFQEAKFYGELIHKRFPKAKSRLSPYLEIRETALALILDESPPHKKFLRDYLNKNSDRGISVLGVRYFSYEELLKTLISDEEPEAKKHKTYPYGLLARIEKNLYQEVDRKKAFRAFQLLRLFPGNFSETFYQKLCDVISVVNYREQLKKISEEVAIENKWGWIGKKNYQKEKIITEDVVSYLSLLIQKRGPSIVNSLKDDVFVQRAAYRAIGLLGKTKLPLVEEMLSHEDEMTRVLGTEALPTMIRTEGLKVLPLVEKSLSDQSSLVRETATQTFPVLTQKLGEDVLPLIEKALTDKSDRVKNRACQVFPVLIDRLGEKSLPLMEKILIKNWYPARVKVSKVFPLLIRKVGKKSLPLIELALTHGYWDTKSEAVKAFPILIETLGEEFLVFLDKMWIKTNPNLHFNISPFFPLMAKKFGEKAIPFFKKVQGHFHGEVDGAACEALETIQSHRKNKKKRRGPNKKSGS